MNIPIGNAGEQLDSFVSQLFEVYGRSSVLEVGELDGGRIGFMTIAHNDDTARIFSDVVLRSTGFLDPVQVLAEHDFLGRIIFREDDNTGPLSTELDEFLRLISTKPGLPAEVQLNLMPPGSKTSTHRDITEELVCLLATGPGETRALPHSYLALTGNPERDIAGDIASVIPNRPDTITAMAFPGNQLWHQGLCPESEISLTGDTQIPVEAIRQSIAFYQNKSND